MLKLALFLSATGVVAGQATMVPCNFHPKAAIEIVLTDIFGQEILHSGLIGNQLVAEVWTSDETGGWTLLLITPDNTACMLASGQFWQTYGPPKNPPNL